MAHVDCTVQKDVCSKYEVQRLQLRTLCSLRCKPGRAHWGLLMQVRGYPTLKVIFNGVEYKAYKGARDLDTLTTYIKEVAAEVLTETTS